MKPLFAISALLLILLAPKNANGQTWQTHTPPFGDTIGIGDIHIVNENIVWAVGLRFGVNDSLYSFDAANQLYFARTTDGGATWTTGTIPMAANGGSPFLANISAVDAGTCFVIGLENFGNAKTLRTNDGGATWTVTQNNWDPVASWPDFIHAFTPAKATVIGDPRNGEFEIFTTVNGQYWFPVDGSKIPDPQSGEYGYNNCGAVSGNNIWFGTNQGRVFRSKDAGLNWEAFSTPLPDVGGISFSDENHGIAIGFTSYGIPAKMRVATTADGGATWTEITDKTPHGGNFRSNGAPAYIPGQPYILMGGTAGGILSGPFETWLSKDRGLTWQQLPGEEIIGWPTFLNASTGWAAEFQQLEYPTRLFKYVGSPLLGMLSPEVLDAEISISPNPASDLARVSVRATELGDFWVLLHDAEGRLLRKVAVSGEAVFERIIILSDLPSGNYSVTVSGEGGSVVRKLAVVR